MVLKWWSGINKRCHFFTNIRSWSQLYSSNCIQWTVNCSLWEKLLLKVDLRFWVNAVLKKPNIEKAFNPLFLMYSYSPCVFLTLCSFHLVRDVCLNFWARTWSRIRFLNQLTNPVLDLRVRLYCFGDIGVWNQRILLNFYCVSLFHMKITASITKNSHQDHGPCYLPLPIFFLYIHSPNLRKK